MGIGIIKIGMGIKNGIGIEIKKWNGNKKIRMRKGIKLFWNWNKTIFWNGNRNLKNRNGNRKKIGMAIEKLEWKKG